MRIRRQGTVDMRVSVCHLGARTCGLFTRLLHQIRARRGGIERQYEHQCTVNSRESVLGPDPESSNGLRTHKLGRRAAPLATGDFEALRGWIHGETSDDGR